MKQEEGTYPIAFSDLVWEQLPRIPGIWVISNPGDLEVGLRDPP